MKKSIFIAAALTFFMVFASCSSNNDEDEYISSGRKQRTLTVTQNTETSGTGAKKISAGPRRSLLIDKGEEGISATWEMGDVMTVYNKTYPGSGYETVRASSSTKNTVFTGIVTCEKGDVLRFFYPAVGTEGSVTGTAGNLTLDISSQKGTLEDIQQHFDFNYGEAEVTDVTDETATANAGNTTNLMAICKFTFKSGGEYLKGIKSVDVNGAVATATYSISARNTPDLTLQTASSVHIAAEGIDKSIYVALFPGDITPTFNVTASDGVYEGSLSSSTLAAGKFYNVTVNMTKTGDSSDGYVEVCGIKWAKGNLIYDPVNGGDEGFMDNWRIAPTQWYTVRTNDSSVKDVFYPFRLGTKAITTAYTHNPSFAQTFDNYSCKMYYDDRSYQETNSFMFATLGDLAFWASNGKYRMPTFGDGNVLINNASYQAGYITVDGNQIYGVLFTTPTGERVTNKTIIKLEEDLLETGLFIPFSKIRGGSTNFQEKVMLSRISASDNYYIYITIYENDSSLSIGTSSAKTKCFIRPILCE